MAEFSLVVWGRTHGPTDQQTDGQTDPLQFLHLLRKFLMLNLLFLRRTVLTLDPMSVKVAFYQKIVLELPLQDLNLHQQDCLLCQSSI